MSLNQQLLPEFDHEMATARTVLSRIPDDKFSWKPHPKSFSMGDLATHVSRLPTWIVITLERDDFDMESQTRPDGGPQTQEQLLQLFDQNVTEARQAITGSSDEALMRPWSLRRGSHVFMTRPKIAVLRSFVLSHMIHHRGQLSVYLRLNDIPVPMIYGPTADDTGAFGKAAAD